MDVRARQLRRALGARLWHSASRRYYRLVVAASRRLTGRIAGRYGGGSLGRRRVATAAGRGVRVFLVTVSPASGAGPGPVLLSLDQTGSHGIRFDVADDAAALEVVAHPMIERFVLPERLPCPLENLVRAAGRGSFDRPRDQRHAGDRTQQSMDVIRHHHISDQVVSAKDAVAVFQGVGDQSGQPRVAQPLGSVYSTIQEAIDFDEGAAAVFLLSVAVGLAGEGTEQPPGEEYGNRLRMPVRQFPAVEGFQVFFLKDRESFGNEADIYDAMTLLSQTIARRLV